MMRLCKDCKWYRPEEKGWLLAPHGRSDGCLSPKLMEPVKGGYVGYPALLRNDGTACGRDAKWFEKAPAQPPAKPWWAR